RDPSSGRAAIHHAGRIFSRMMSRPPGGATLGLARVSRRTARRKALHLRPRVSEAGGVRPAGSRAAGAVYWPRPPACTGRAHAIIADRSEAQRADPLRHAEPLPEAERPGA